MTPASWVDRSPPRARETGRVQPGEIVTLHVGHATAFAAQGAEQYRALVECTEFVNERRTLEGLPPLPALTFRDSK